MKKKGKRIENQGQEQIKAPENVEKMFLDTDQKLIAFVLKNVLNEGATYELKKKL